jgi:hypothetical protein
LGAWDFLQWKHVHPIYDEKGVVVAAKLSVYPGDLDEYYTFVSREAYKSLEDWMDFRSSYGEKITGTSWLRRDIFRREFTTALYAYKTPYRSRFS